MQCSEIHQETPGCTQEIRLGANWKFCPNCGRLVAHLAVPDGRLNGDAGRDSRSLISLRNHGPNTLKASAVLIGTIKGVKLASEPTHVVIAPLLNAPVEVHLPPLLTSVRQAATLLIESNDGPRGVDQGPWDEPKLRQIRVPLSINVASAASIVALQTICLFRDGISERTVELRNTGQSNAEVVDIREPDGYEVSPRQGLILAEGSLEFKVRLRPRQPSPDPGDEFQDLTFQFSDGPPLSITLHRARSGGIQRVPKAIIGIDFGTAFTTVAFREYRNNAQLDDPVTFLRLPDEPDPRRFRTRIRVGKDSEFQFASKATERFEARESDGYLFREIKTLLRDKEKDLIHLQKARGEAIEFMTRKYGADWPQALVTEYLSWLYQTLVLPELKQRYGDTVSYIRYVFSLPVLDFNPGGIHPIYDLQRSQMETCVAAAGFPMDAVEFQFEPVCAAIGLLHPQDGPNWPRLGTQKSPLKTGDTIALFDSGGGTTDVVLMEAIVENGKVILDVERCLGVGSKTETFGGELVTSNLLTGIKDPRTIESDGDAWFDAGVGGMDIDTVFGEDVASGDLELRDAGEELKQELALDEPITRDGIEIQPSILFYIVQSYLASLTEALPEHVFDQVPQEKTNYYLCVGGNTYLPVVQLWVEKHMRDYKPAVSGRQLRLPEEYRKLAVAYGAVWVWDARIRNAVPYALDVYAHDTRLLSLAPNTSEETFPHTETLVVPGGQTLDCRVIASIEGRSFQVGAGSVYNPYDEETQIDLRTDVQHGTVRILFKLGDRADYMPLISYQL